MDKSAKKARLWYRIFTIIFLLIAGIFCLSRLQLPSFNQFKPSKAIEVQVDKNKIHKNNQKESKTWVNQKEK